LEVEPLTDAGIEEAEQRAAIFRLFRELPDDQRRVLEMRFVEDRTTRDIAERLGRTEGAIKQLQFRGLETIRARIGGQNG
jgi:RNA polymerase sigma factor (sigma-70 family)